MKLNKNAIDILQNFATINNSLMFLEGAVQKTASSNKTIFARATFDEPFETDFAVYDLTKFINVLSLFKAPEISVDDKYAHVFEGNQKILYRLSDTELVKSVQTKKEIELPSVDVSFEIGKEDVQQLMRATRLLSDKTSTTNPSLIAFSGNGERIVARTVKKKDENASYIEIDLGPTSLTFNMMFNVDKLKILFHSYDIQISRKGLTKLISKDAQIEYFIPAEEKSTFGD